MVAGVAVVVAALTVPASSAGPVVPVVSESVAQGRAVLALQQAQAAARQAAAQQAAARQAAVARQLAARRAAARQLEAQRAAAARAAASAAVARPVRAPAPVLAPAVVRPAETAAQRGSRVLASLHYDLGRLGYRIEFLPAKGGYLGMTIGSRKLVQIYVRSSQSDLVLAHSIAHEVGHVLDFTRGNESTRAQYLSIRRLDPRLTWYGCSGCSDFRTPAGDWAEVFAYWLAGPGDFRSQMAGAPTNAQLRSLDALFRL